ncbi:MAG: T9SS type A sorting domain-containing protein [Bacteroidetes bacterium]|nr:T9SS type A sorting domain-containing protein [Bacteroidota bacterium]
MSENTILTHLKRAGFQLVLLGLALVMTFNIHAQGWEYVFGGSAKDDAANAFIHTKDGGFLIVGLSQSFGDDNDTDVYVIRTDIDGEEIWSNVYDENITERAYAVLETDEGDFVIVGEISTEMLNIFDVYILKIDRSGNLIWSKRYGSELDDRGLAITKGIDDGYVVAGSTIDSETGEKDIYLLKIDDQGELLWETSFGEAGGDEASGIVAIEEGYALVGYTDNIGNNSRDIYLAKTDDEGSVLWNKSFGSSELDEGNGIIATEDGGLAIIGVTGNNSDALLLKTNENGDIQWTQTYGGPYIDKGESIIQTPDGGYVITGATEITLVNIDIFLAKTDDKGQELWMKTIGSEDRGESANALTLTSDGGFAIVGKKAVGTSFFVNDAILIKTDAFGNIISNHVNGSVYFDTNNSCEEEEEDIPLRNWLVKVEGTANTYYGTTDAHGHFSILTDTGAYNVSVLTQNDYWFPCIDDYNIILNDFYDSLNVDFPMQAAIECPMMEVDISTAFLAACSDVNYTVNYCNNGTGTATNVYVQVTLDEELTFHAASIPYGVQDGVTYRFSLGDLSSGDCGSFTINTSLPCEGIANGQAGLVSAHIYPDTLCFPINPIWDGSSVNVDGVCQPDSLRFKIRNIGDHPMDNHQVYYVVEDEVMFKQDSFRLDEGDSLSVAVPAEGYTYRIIAEQSEGHPGNSYPTVAIEGCTINNSENYSTGFVTQFPEDEKDPFISIDVQEIEGSEISTSLRGYPKGYGEDHIIEAKTDLEYILFFKNTGTDTVTRVVIRDTLSQYLDISTVIPGASSHPYEYKVYNDGVLKFTFTNIHLTDSSTDEATSYGYVKFKVSQNTGNALNTVIVNSAAIFLGYDAPVITNEVFHTVGERLEDFVIISDTDEPFIPGLQVKVYPNPFTESTTIELIGLDLQTIHLNVFDLTGKIIRREKAISNQLKIERKDLHAGMYLYTIESDGQLLNSGKILVR